MNPDDFKTMLGRAAGAFLADVIEGATEAALEVVEERLDGARAKVRETKKKVRRRKKVVVDVKGSDR